MKRHLHTLGVCGKPLGTPAGSGMCWGALGRSGAVWEAMGSPGKLWEPLGDFGKLWESLGHSSKNKETNQEVHRGQNAYIPSHISVKSLKK